MIRFLRWQGLIIFIAICALIAAVTELFLDSWISWSVSKSVSNITGAEVNIANVEHSFSPLGISLSDIQLTDAAQPENNSVQIAQLGAHISFTDLLYNRIIIDDLTATGVMFNQNRDKKGEVYRSAKTSHNELPPDEDNRSKEMDAAALLAKAPLKTDDAVKTLQQRFEQNQTELKQQYKTLPDKEKLKQYQQRIKSLSETDFKNTQELAKATAEFNQLKTEIKQDKQKFSDFRNQVEQTKAQLNQDINQLKQAKDQDYALIKGMVTGNLDAYADATEMIFGDTAHRWRKPVMTAIELVGPLLEKKQQEQKQQREDQGRWFAFDGSSDMPQFLIKKSDIDITFKNQRVKVNVTDITTDHARLGRPTLFDATASHSDLWENLSVHGQFKLLGGELDAWQNWQITQLSLPAETLSSQEKLTALLNKGKLTSNGQLNVTKGKLDGNTTIKLDQLSIEASGQNNITNIIANALNSLNTLTINATLRGDVINPDVSLTSDLDKQLAANTASILPDNIKQKLNKVSALLDDKSQQGQASQQQDWQQWLSRDSDAESAESQLEQLLKTKLNNLLDKEKDKLKEKLKNKLFGN
ncbi:TIGR03545 family protein [Neptunicella marina]|uniref:TIGR03545 family protein n=1 Tax=Neptunicella marina TaxID=2125989 RepID=A0A8J6IUT3_9ALTE|nr:TIGR03545 family protein [Neptunicella marina]MBC3766307.1 TIGR03545 family protein [Neptunicella marina]